MCVCVCVCVCVSIIHPVSMSVQSVHKSYFACTLVKGGANLSLVLMHRCYIRAMAIVCTVVFALDYCCKPPLTVVRNLLSKELSGKGSLQL